MTCGKLPTGGCANPDLGHDGPCTPEPTNVTNAHREAFNEKAGWPYRRSPNGSDPAVDENCGSSHNGMACCLPAGHAGLHLRPFVAYTQWGDDGDEQLTRLPADMDCFDLGWNARETEVNGLLETVDRLRAALADRERGA